ncbi:MAG: glycerol-3-phosphate 1-O-acyltransferase PlsY [Candidatus Eremiobacteraeota bacterium]|nr:glycerol-3-phosphate 1-O-acyltransferase PlsY [Candidatus Eremiobacteraeota bacterium]
MNALAAAAAAVGAFAVGSIPFGYVIGRIFYRTDIRASGSGNIGAMNALRTLGKTGAIAVLVLDAAKGFLPVFLLLVAHRPELAVIAATAAVLGHCFSPWLGWKGGKGVATSFGAIFALSWKVGLLAVAGWLLGALATTYSSVGSMLGNAVAPFAFYFLIRNLPFTAYGIFAALLIAYTHRENIGRIRAGTESGISFLRR